ncbi:MAG: penicillin acylase family protein, partial [Planctomycetota bacterium]
MIRLRTALVLCLVLVQAVLVSVPVESQEIDSKALARSVTIVRDDWGVAHIDGPTDESVAFGFAYAQAEDFFWQVEDTYILALGRYSEVYGDKELKRDIRNRVFRVVPEAQADYPKLSPKLRGTMAAFTAGLNYYLEKNPQVKPRLIRKFEPWFVLAYARALTLELCFRVTRVGNGVFEEGPIWKRRGSNAWAISGSRTKSGKSMLLINPHQPWYGFGQFYEAHLRSGEGWNFSGATFFGSPIPTLGHNESAGWAMTVNEPDIADAWEEVFDDPKRPNHYRHGKEYREATTWDDEIRVKNLLGLVETKKYSFRATHHGPIVKKIDDTKYLSVNIAKFKDSFGGDQILEMMRVKNLGDFKRAMGRLTLPIFNVVYADKHGDIYYLYGGIVPKRSSRFDWSKPVDGS